MSDTAHRLRVIRILSGGTLATQEDRLEKIRKLAAREMAPSEAQPTPQIGRIMEVLKAGRESRSPRTAADIVAERVQVEQAKAEEEDQKRKQRRGRDRMERSGRDRGNVLTSGDV